MRSEKIHAFTKTESSRCAGFQSGAATISANRENDTSVTLMMRIQQNLPTDQAWEQFVVLYHPMIRAWCLKWHLQPSDADDVVQDVLVKLVAAIRKLQYDPGRSFRPWLKTVTQHALRDYCQSPTTEPGRIAGPIEMIAESMDARRTSKSRSKMH